MGAILPWCSNPSNLLSFPSLSHSSPTSRLLTRSSPGDLSFLKKKGDTHCSLGQKCFTNWTEIHENSAHQWGMPFLQTGRLSSTCGALIRDGIRFTSLKDLTDIERRPFNLFGRWYIYKSRVIYCTKREEHGGRHERGWQERSYSQEVDLVDHYKVLGLRRQATASAIKLAYRQLARQLHPDVNKDVDANEKFMSVRLAYEVLSDETNRKLYDSSLLEQVKLSRRKQVYQRRERDTWTRSRHDKSHYRRAPYENAEWSYSMYSYENEYSNMESYYYTYPTSGIFSNNKKKSSRNHSNRGKPSEEEDMKQMDLHSIGREALLFLWVVSALWHALGAQTALGLLVGSLALWKDFAVGYRLASGVAWLMGGEKGLALMVALIVTTRVFGRAYHSVAAIVALALWLGGGVLKALPLPHGAILVLVYKCIQLQASIPDAAVLRMLPRAAGVLY